MIARFLSMVSFSDFWKCFFTVLIPETGKVTDSNLLNAWQKKTYAKNHFQQKPWDWDAFFFQIKIWAPKKPVQKTLITASGIFFFHSLVEKHPTGGKTRGTETPRRPKRRDLENTWPMRWRFWGWILGWRCPFWRWTEVKKTGWWFQISFMFTPIWGNDPIWLIFFKRVETTN